MSSYTPENTVKPSTTAKIAYEKKFDLAGVHEKRVTSIAFSPDGRYIATCSEDCSVTLWLVSTGEATHRIVARSAVLCATWPIHPESLICGTADGTLLTIAMSPVCDHAAFVRARLITNHAVQPHVVVTGFDAHIKPIEHLVVNDPSPSVFSHSPSTVSRASSARWRLASAGHDEIRVWLSCSKGQQRLRGHFDCSSSPAEWVPEQMVKHPPPTSQSDNKPFLVTGLQWLPHADEDYDDLVVAYLFHGI